jgi:high affinity Mn2+ porin
MNGTLVGIGGLWFPADLPGHTRGAMVELNRKDGASRGALVG